LIQIAKRVGDNKYEPVTPPAKDGGER